jgi:hypothetical protein
MWLFIVLTVGAALIDAAHARAPAMLQWDMHGATERHAESLCKGGGAVGARICRSIGAGWWEDVLGEETQVFKPSHWMPLPEPPVSEEQT